MYTVSVIIQRYPFSFSLRGSCVFLCFQTVPSCWHMILYISFFLSLFFLTQVVWALFKHGRRRRSFLRTVFLILFLHLCDLTLPDPLAHTRNVSEIRIILFTFLSTGCCALVLSKKTLDHSLCDFKR